MSALAVDVYKGSIILGSGSINSGSTSLTSYSANSSRLTGTNRNVQVAVTTVGASAGSTWATRVVTDGGATLTLADACPFV